MKEDGLTAPSSVVDGVGRQLGLLADETRFRALYALVGTELCVSDVADTIGASRAVASHHLRVLHDAGLVAPRWEGRSAYYRITDDTIVVLMRAIIEWARQRSALVQPCSGARPPAP